MLPQVQPGTGEILNLSLGTEKNPKLIDWMNKVSSNMKAFNPHLHKCFFDYIKDLKQDGYKVSVVDVVISGLIIYDMLDRQDEIDELRTQWES